MNDYRHLIKLNTRYY